MRTCFSLWLPFATGFGDGWNTDRLPPFGDEDVSLGVPVVRYPTHAN
jgi:hypothetical protein